MKSAINGDKVLFKLLNNYNHKGFEGAIIKIIERSKNEFIGKIEDHNDFAFFIPDNKKIFTDFFIKKKSKKKYDNNIKVLVKVTNWNSRRKPEADVIKIIGKSGENDTEIHSIIHDFNLSTSFPKSVVKETHSLIDKISNEETFISTSPVNKSLLIVSFDLLTTFPNTHTTDSGLIFSTALKKLLLFSITHCVNPK